MTMWDFLRWILEDFLRWAGFMFLGAGLFGGIVEIIKASKRKPKP